MLLPSTCFNIISMIMPPFSYPDNPEHPTSTKPYLHYWAEDQTSKSSLYFLLCPWFSSDPLLGGTWYSNQAPFVCLNLLSPITGKGSRPSRQPAWVQQPVFHCHELLHRTVICRIGFFRANHFCDLCGVRAHQKFTHKSHVFHPVHCRWWLSGRKLTLQIWLDNFQLQN